MPSHARRDGDDNSNGSDDLIGVYAGVAFGVVLVLLFSRAGRKNH